MCFLASFVTPSCQQLSEQMQFTEKQQNEVYRLSQMMREDNEQNSSVTVYHYGLPQDQPSLPKPKIIPPGRRVWVPGQYRHRIGEGEVWVPGHWERRP